MLYKISMGKWYLYILDCADKTLYTGITLNLKRRVDEHNSGKGSRYTRARRPAKLVFNHEFPDRSAASKAEFRIKQLTRKQKQHLIQGKITLDEVLFTAPDFKNK